MKAKRVPDSVKIIAKDFSLINKLYDVQKLVLGRTNFFMITCLKSVCQTMRDIPPWKLNLSEIPNNSTKKKHQIWTLNTLFRAKQTIFWIRKNQTLFQILQSFNFATFCSKNSNYFRWCLLCCIITHFSTAKPIAKFVAWWWTHWCIRC